MLNADLRAAYQELLAFIGATRPSLSEELRSANDAVIRMVGGTEEDAERAEEILRRLPPRHSRPGGFAVKTAYQFPRLRDVIERLVLHRARSGHVIAPFR